MAYVNNACTSGSVFPAFSYFKDNYIMYESKYPYSGSQDMSCRYYPAATSGIILSAYGKDTTSLTAAIKTYVEA